MITKRKLDSMRVRAELKLQKLKEEHDLKMEGGVDTDIQPEQTPPAGGEMKDVVYS
jgi:hypothetical protein